MPITFDDIFGQDQAIGFLRQTYRADRLPHGLIFAGPVGVGKAATAEALGQLFLCEKPKSNATPCGKCESCRVFEAGNHPDYHVITKELIRYHDKSGTSKARDLSINVIRPELIAKAAMKPVMNVGKVFVIEQADLMSPQAQNAMLKTLEEPAGRAVIILLTDQPDALLPTVRSRCQLVRFASLDESKVKAELVKRGIDKETAAQAAALSDGSLGLAIKWIDDGVVAAAGELLTRLDSIIGAGGSGDLADWIRKAADAYAEKQLARDSLGSKDQANREGLALYLRLASQQFGRLLGEQDDPDGLEQICRAIDSIVQSEEYLDANVNIPLVLHQLSLALERQFSPAPTAAAR
jgi:DNA polymerase-3 subunit delta'